MVALLQEMPSQVRDTSTQTAMLGLEKAQEKVSPAFGLQCHQQVPGLRLARMVRKVPNIRLVMAAGESVHCTC
jgi:hypothetical protein